jgi:prevent-host-death family protein
MKPIEIGAFEAKNRLSELLQKAEKGQKIYITRRGRRVAVLSGAAYDESSLENNRRTLIKEIRAFRAAAKSGPEPLKRLVEEGRR